MKISVSPKGDRWVDLIEFVILVSSGLSSIVKAMSS